MTMLCKSIGYYRLCAWLSQSLSGLDFPNIEDPRISKLPYIISCRIAAHMQWGRDGSHL